MTFNSTTTTMLYLSLFILLFHLSTQIKAYEPEDRFTISCGTTGTVSDGERTWTGDTDSKLLSLNNPTTTTVSVTATTQAPSINRVLYSTARLSHSEFTYSFPLTTGPKFLRLFFYPASYSTFDRTQSFFTVKSGGFTLLQNFNASLKADTEGKETIFKEYIINVDDGQRLNLTFTPNTTSQPNSYAFINGIEVLSMPNDLYYTEGFKLVGTSTTQYSVSSKTALETDYRIKVGGQAISPVNDTGLLRIWEGHDEDYLKTPSARFSLPGDTSGKMNISVNPDYVAPVQLYRTARDMGTNGTLNKISNLTWDFQVDSGFYYMVRLHFCELDPNINEFSDRVFFIYIDGQIAEERADVLRWSKQKGVAVHRDYAVSIPLSNNQKRVNVSIQMHPYTEDKDTKFSDPFLNGLEIFKISDTVSNNLAGPNPDPIQTPGNPPVFQNAKSKRNVTVVVAGVVSGVVVLVLIVVVLFLFLVKRKTTTTTKTKDSKSSATSKWDPLSFSTTKSTNTQNSSLPSDLCRQFSLVEIKSATNNFDEVFIVGVGGFGHVYKGYVDNGLTAVAIKRLKPGSQQGANEFMNEIHMLSQLRHLHLVSLIGYCNENNEMILVYDYMTRGTLRDHLYNTDNPALSWKKRLQICIGAARGLHYLHTGAKHVIIHRDVKTTNILLDEKWVAKVSDFGLSRIGPTGIGQAHVSTVVKGSVGYLDPEYYKRQRLTEKSDVYSFGVVLFEILCARPSLIRTADKKQVSLADWARQCYKSGTLGQIVDPALKGSIAPECLRKYGEIGVSCLLDDGTQRPSMNDVVWMLEFALQLQESAEQRDENGVGLGIVVVEEKRDDSDDMLFSSGTSLGQVSDFNKSSGVSVTTSSGEHSYGDKESGKLMSGTVFSEIMDPKAR